MKPLKFFVSYTQADRDWAEWIAWQIRENGHEVAIQAWHFGPGSNFVSEMQKAMSTSDVTIAVLSPDYLESAFCESEWGGAFAQDPKGKKRKLVPVRVRECQPTGLLAQLVWVDLVKASDEGEAAKALGSVFRESGVPAVKPSFPRTEPETAPAFPGIASSTETHRPTPKYSNEDIRRVSEKLKAARKERTRLKIKGEDTTDLNQEIVRLKRILRAGVQLEAGDSLLGERYELIERIGHGGFADVWLAWDEERDHRVAIKVLHNQHARDASRIKRFYSGARQMGKLDHSDIVRVLSQPREDRGYHFFVMEYLAGGDFQRAIKVDRLTLDESWRVVLGVGEALKHGHNLGIIHRDVKPANILLDEDLSPKLTDFDLVRAAETTGGTRTGAMGTFVYAAPEMLHRPQDAKPNVDVYGLGMTAIFALYGKDLPLDVFRDAGRFLKGLKAPAQVKEVLARAVEWEDSKRWSSVSAFCEALSGALAQESPVPRREPDPTSTSPSNRKSFQASIRKLIAEQNPNTLGGARQILLAGEEWQDSAPDRLQGVRGEELHQKLRQLLVRVMQFRDLPAPERQAAGLIASDLGDLPEDLDHLVPLPEEWFGYPFKIGKYPVTNAQYRRFMEAGGYDRDITGIGSRKEPPYWTDRNRNRATQPVIGVSWYEAEAYCKWLTEKLRASGELGNDQIVRLPTFEERKKVAGGPEGRTFPWGGEEDVRFLNCEESKIGNPSPVHMYPDGVTPQGVWDLSGNVWEWLLDRDEEKDIPVYFLGGGAWYRNISLETSVARFRRGAGDWNVSLGFRVSVSPLLL